MSNITIKAENLGKRYFIRHEKKESYETFQDVLIDAGKKIITSLNPFDKSSAIEDKTIEEFWAFKDVNFEINKGDKVGIVGRNGAGKLIFLKVVFQRLSPKIIPLRYLVQDIDTMEDWARAELMYQVLNQVKFLKQGEYQDD